MKRREREEEGECEKEVFLDFFGFFYLFMLHSDEYDRSFLSLPFFFGVCVFVMCIVIRMPTPPFPSPLFPFLLWCRCVCSGGSGWYEV